MFSFLFERLKLIRQYKAIILVHVPIYLMVRSLKLTMKIIHPRLHFIQASLIKKKTQSSSPKKLQITLLYKKCICKIMMILTPCYCTCTVVTKNTLPCSLKLDVIDGQVLITNKKAKVLHN